MPTPGTPTTFESFYSEHYAPLAVQLYAYTGDLPRAQALTQEAFCRALADWSRITRYDEPGAWVRRAAWSLATSRWRRLTEPLRRRPAPPPGAAPAAPIQPSAEQAELLAALKTLPARVRRVFLLRYLAGRTSAEISEQEHVKLRKVTAAVDRAQQSLTPRLTATRAAIVQAGIADV